MLPPLRKSPFRKSGGDRSKDTLAEASIAAASSEGVVGTSKLQISSFRLDVSAFDSYDAVMDGNNIFLFDIGKFDLEALL